MSVTSVNAPFGVTLLSNSEGPLTKRVALDPDGTLDIQSSATIFRGTAERVHLKGLDAFAALLMNLRACDAIALGDYAPGLPDRVGLVTASELRSQPKDTIARTADCLTLREGRHGILFLDKDTKGISDSVLEFVDNFGYWESLVSAAPGIKGVGHVSRASTSSAIFNMETGETCLDTKGEHVHVIIKDAGDSARALRVLHDLCWLVGLGWGDVSGSGTFLNRSIVDRLVWGPERIDYEASPILVPPLAQSPHSRAPKVTHGCLLDTRKSLPPLTKEQKVKVNELVEAEKVRLGPKMAEVYAAAQQRHANRIHDSAGCSWVDAIQMATLHLAGTLSPDVQLPFDNKNLRWATVRECYANPKKYVGKSMADPNEGESYGWGKAILYDRPSARELWIKSFAHGGTSYEMIDENAKPRSQTVHDEFPPEALANGQEEIIEIDWTKKLLRNETKDGPGGIKPVLANAIIAFDYAPEWKNNLAHNNFSVRVRLNQPPPWSTRDDTRSYPRDGTDDDMIRATKWLHEQGIMVAANVAKLAWGSSARLREVHPIREYLDSLTWDGIPRINKWLHEHLGADDTRLHEAFGSKFLISAVARILQPGCKVDTVLILESKQGLKKSQALNVLGHPWYVDHIPDLHSKDALQQIQGVWIVEHAEMDKLRRVESNRAKAFISTRVDRFRPPYAAAADDFPRQCVFAATVNPEGAGYLKDETGARRYWPFECAADWDDERKIDLDYLGAVRDQLWAEALVRYRQGEAWWLDTPELEQYQEDAVARRYDQDVWTDTVLKNIASVPRISIAEILQRFLGKSQIENATPSDHYRVGRILGNARWRRTTENGRQVFKNPNPSPAPESNVVPLQGRAELADLQAAPGGSAF